jgi:membrane-associated phospholipid phosphatase
MVLAVAATFWLAGYRVESLFAGLAAVGISLLGAQFKLLWQRPRPADDLVQVLSAPAGYSFPSGHTLLYVGFFGFLFYWSYAFLKKGRLRTALLWLFGLLILLVGPSRVYLGHHWASDVLAAYGLGLAYLFVLIRLYGAVRLGTLRN